MATLVAIALYALLPEGLLVGPRSVIPVLGVLLLVALTWSTRGGSPGRPALSRVASLAWSP